MTLGTRIAIWSRPSKHFGILIDEPARAPHGPYLEKVRKNKNSDHVESSAAGNPELELPKTELSQGGARGIATVFRARALPNFRLSKKLIY